MWSSISDKIRNLLSELYLTSTEKGVLVFVVVSLILGTALQYFRRSFPSVFSIAQPSKSPAVDTEVVANRIQKPIEFPINLNTATQEELEAIPGIGPKLAERILEYRERRGKIRNLRELMNVNGIGPKRFERIKPYVKL